MDPRLCVHTTNHENVLLLFLTDPSADTPLYFQGSLNVNGIRVNRTVIAHSFIFKKPQIRTAFAPSPLKQLDWNACWYFGKLNILAIPLALTYIDNCYCHILEDRLFVQPLFVASDHSTFPCSSFSDFSPKPFSYWRFHCCLHLYPIQFLVIVRLSLSSSLNPYPKCTYYWSSVPFPNVMSLRIMEKISVYVSVDSCCIVEWGTKLEWLWHDFEVFVCINLSLTWPSFTSYKRTSKIGCALLVPNFLPFPYVETSSEV